jgi:high mobility group protein B2
MESPQSANEVWGDVVPMVPKKKRRLQKKAPGAPKRGKSPYILFSMDKRDEIKSSMPSDAKVTDVMRAIADAWSKMSDEEKAPWKTAAESDKQRYEEEMATYDGPLRVPNKRAKKHPNAPKRASSAFLFYSQVMRPRIKAEHADMKNTDISKQLGEAWAKASQAQKAPFVEKEKEDRARYRREMEEWNSGKADREYAEQHSQQYTAPYGLDQFAGYGHEEAFHGASEV